MKTIVALAAALFMMACSPSQSPPQAALMPTQEASPAKAPATIIAGYSMSGPYTHANLTVFLLHSPGVAKDTTNYLTLEEALQAKTLLVTEKGEGGQVNTLEVQNTGDQPVFLQAGDTVKGGKQDRTIGVDMLLQPKSGKQDVAAFCVEPGRWAARGSADGSVRYANVFGAASAPVASKEQKLAVKLSQDQSKVWDEGRKVQKGLADNAELKESRGRVTGAASYVVTSELPEIEKQTQAYVEALLKVAQSKADAVGMAYAVNGEASTLEVYSSPAFFQKLWPKLLKGAAVDAFSKKSGSTLAREAAAEDIKQLLTRASDGKTTTRDLPQDVRLETIDAAKTAIFETRVKGELLHRQVMTK